MTQTATAVIRRAIDPGPSVLRPEVAQYLAEIDLRPEDHARYEILSAKAREGSLTPGETEELGGLLEADSVLSLIRLRAERSLRATGGAA